MNKNKVRNTVHTTGRSRETRSKGKNISKLQIFIIIGVFIIVLLGILAIPYYQNYIKPFNRTIISIDNKNISMGYFLDQVKLTKSDPMTMLQTLTQEELIKMEAPKYGIKVTNADVERYLRAQAASPGGTISDIEFREWYRQQLNNSKVSDSQYKKTVSFTILSNRLQGYLAARVPTVMPQVHLNWIVVSSEQAADNAIARINSGESFADVAKDVSLDTSTKDNGGDLGWFPPEVAASQFSISESTIDKLAVDQVSEPFAHYAQQSSTSTSQQNQTPDYWYILMVSTKDNAHQVDSNSLSVLKNNALNDWYSREIKIHNVRYNFNSETYAWINYQLQKSSPVTPGTTTTTTGSSGNSGNSSGGG